MKKRQRTLRIENNIIESLSYMAFELSEGKWKLVFWDGKKLSKDLKERAVREYERLRMVEDQIKLLRKGRESRVKSGANASYSMVAQLRSLYGIGKTSSWDFIMERFGHGGKRIKRIGIVAVPQRLLIDLWRYLEYGVVAEGVCLTTVA